MKIAGFKQLDIRLNDKVYILDPPYEDPAQQCHLKIIKDQTADMKKRRKKWIEREKKFYLAGGGSIRKFNRVMRIYDKILTAMKRQVKSREFFCCLAGSFYIAKGTKPG